MNEELKKMLDGIKAKKQEVRDLCKAGKIEDAAKAKEIYEATCRRKDKYLMQGEVRSDIALMKSILTAANVL